MGNISVCLTEETGSSPVIPAKFIDVVGYEEYFMVSDDGRLFSKRTNKILSQNIVGKGYLAHVTKIGGRTGKNLCLKTHRVVAEAFLPNPYSLPEVNHKDGNKLNNCVSNLEWVTSSENTKHSYANKLKVNKKSHNHVNSKLTKEDVEFILKSDMSHRSLASKFGVSHKTIQRAIKRNSV